MGRINLLRWQNGEYLGAAILMPEIEQKYGAPQYCIHRADLHSAIMEDARTVAEICVDSKVVDIDFEKPSVTLQNGKVLEADLVVGADGSSD
jgi:salicylate hydroxylase